MAWLHAIDVVDNEIRWVLAATAFAGGIMLLLTLLEALLSCCVRRTCRRYGGYARLDASDWFSGLLYSWRVFVLRWAFYGFALFISGIPALKKQWRRAPLTKSARTASTSRVLPSLDAGGHHGDGSRIDVGTQFPERRWQLWWSGAFYLSATLAYGLVVFVLIYDGSGPPPSKSPQLRLPAPPPPLPPGAPGALAPAALPAPALPPPSPVPPASSPINPCQVVVIGSSVARGCCPVNASFQISRRATVLAPHAEHLG